MDNSKFKTFLPLLLLYICFIGLGLPDEVLGVSWVQMRKTLNLGVSTAGIIVSVVTIFTIASSFLSVFFIKRFSIGKIITLSTFLIVIGVLGFATSKNLLWLLAFCPFFGLGAGTVDAAVNNYAVSNYDTKTVNWLHAFWGIGATTGPAIFTFVFACNLGWRIGYFILAMFLLPIALLFLIKGQVLNDKSKCEEKIEENNCEKIFSKKAFLAVFFFFMYAAVEMGAGLWIGTNMAEYKKFTIAQAGFLTTAFFASLTLGRFLMGALSIKFKTENIIKYGIIFAILNMFLFMSKSLYLNAFALLFYGFSISGFYPCMLNLSSTIFSRATFDKLCGIELGFAGIGVCTIPLMIGFLIDKINAGILPCIIIFVLFIMLVCFLNLIKKEPSA